MTTLTTFRINTSKSVSKQRTLSSFRMNTYEKQRGGGVLSLTRHPMKGVCPERPSGVKDLSSNPTKDFYPACPNHVGEEHRGDGTFRPRRKGISSVFGRLART